MNKQFATLLTIVSIASATTLPAVEPPPAGTDLGSVKGGDFSAAQGIIASKCTRCHSAAVIDTALHARKDMMRIEREMEKRGAALSAEERDVLGIYWKQQTPLKQKK
ncbi:cytochrome C [Geobacter sp. SVR]|uniref:cytochrome C n=1 Tax=Geobacter sp. SVR TaxID=2495594 RepID=UPI00143F0096|nr:cytochrome C [Geobacter sp. SVR]BCS52403.1 hypothetical protein GSVR_07110 [Geobacter sp. SVR]GCF87364.1 hypothetical protein GSbR_39640 [Geobacter sp. SVR]